MPVLPTIALSKLKFEEGLHNAKPGQLLQIALPDTTEAGPDGVGTVLKPGEVVVGMWAQMDPLSSQGGGLIVLEGQNAGRFYPYMHFPDRLAINVTELMEMVLVDAFPKSEVHQAQPGQVFLMADDEGGRLGMAVAAIGSRVGYIAFVGLSGPTAGLRLSQHQQYHIGSISVVSRKPSNQT